VGVGKDERVGSTVTSTSPPLARNFNPIANRWLGAPGISPLSDQPLVSIIVPSFNQGRYIRDTIASILGQTYRNLEIIVVDGASKDETLEVLAEFSGESRLRVLSEPDQGVADAVNKGFHLARGEILAIQSSDDCYVADSVELAVKALSGPVRPGIAYGEVVIVDACGRALGRSSLGQYSLEAWLTKSAYIPQPSTFFRQCLLERVGGWDSAYFNADTEFWLRLIWQAPVVKINRELARRRMHGGQRDTQRAKISESYARMIKQSPAIRSLPLRLRQAAQAGVFLHRVRYNPDPSASSTRWLLWRAVLTYPPVLRALPARYRLVPFGAEALRMAGRVRRALGLKPTT